MLCSTSSRTDEPAAEGKEKPDKPESQPSAEESDTVDQGTDLEAKVASLEAKVASLTEELASKQDSILRALAEAENARRRAALDVEGAHKFAVGKFAKDLLDVADNLGRAEAAVPEELRNSDEQPALKALFEGVVLTDKALHKVFEKNGLAKCDPLGDKFDPNLHDALFEIPDPDKEPGTIAHVASLGYILHERVIRAAGVGIVAKR